MLSKAEAPTPVTPEGVALLEYSKGLDGRIAALAAALAAISSPPDSSLFTAKDHGYRAWTVDPQAASATGGLGLGTLHVSKAKVATPGTISTVTVPIITAGSGLTVAKVAVFDATGAQLAVSPDQSASFQSAGYKAVALSAPTRALVAGEVIFFAILVTGTSAPATQNAPAASALNFGIPSTDGPRAGTLAGQTDMPTSLTLSGLTGTSTNRLLIGS